MFDNKTLPHVIRSLVTGLRTTVSARGCSSVVAELDGGLNSAVALGLLHQCGVKTIGVIFDSELSELASQLSRRFQIDFVRINQDVELPTEEELAGGFVDLWKLAWLDTTARKMGGLVTHHVNRDDFRWIFQLNSRLMSVDLLPLAGLHFSEVQQLGKFLGVPELPEESPSGIPYSQLEELCRVFSLYPYATREILEDECDSTLVPTSVLETYLDLAVQNKHLIKPEPFWCELDEFRQ